MLYHSISIHGLPELVKELLHNQQFPPTSYSTNPFYFNVKSPSALHFPLLHNFINNKLIIDRVLFSVPLDTVGNVSPIHIDGLVGSANCFAINIPLVNTAGSYTVFYETVSTDGKVFGVNTAYPDESSNEIGRVSLDSPAIVNTSIPHRGVSALPGRIIASIRFVGNPPINTAVEFFA